MSDRFEFPFEREAMRGEPMPPDLSLVDQMAYTTLRNIYFSYYHKIINQEIAAKDKQQLVRNYVKDIESQENQDTLAAFRARMVRDTEKAATICRKDPTPENAIQLCDVLDGIKKMRGDENEQENKSAEDPSNLG